MALEIKFEGYVLEVNSFTWGNAVKVSHQQRAKNDATGEWETVGYDYLEVITDRSDIAKGDIVRVEGTLKKGKIYSKKDGTQDVDLKVRATSLEKVDRAAQNVERVLGGVPVAEDAPF